MNRKAVIVGAIMFLLVGGAGEAVAQSNGGGTKTIWDGVYTEKQAERGEQVVQQNCGACHSSSEWSNARFLGTWNGRPISELHNQIRTTMPFDGPGRLTREEYADIVAYILQLNKVPAGSTELPAEDQGLASITVTRPGGR